VTVRGTIFSVAWENPHVSVALDVRAANGSVDRWIVALSPPHVMTRKGLGRETLKVGDVLSAIGYTATGSQRMNSAEFTLADGSMVTTGNENWKPLSKQ
jgi:hypothetical protein